MVSGHHHAGPWRSITALAVTAAMLLPANVAMAAPAASQPAAASQDSVAAAASNGTGSTATGNSTAAKTTDKTDTKDADALLRAVGESADKSSKNDSGKNATSGDKGLLSGSGDATTGIATIIVQLDDTTAGVPWFRSLFGVSKQTRHREIKNDIRDLAANEPSLMSADGAKANGKAKSVQVSDVQDYYHAIDGFAVKAPAALLDGIRELPGVKRAFIESKYSIPDEKSAADDSTPDLKNQSSLDMTGADKAAQKGDGQTIAIIDSGLDTDHEAFQGDLDDAKVKMSKSDAESKIKELGHGTYVSEKIPFARDYADNDDNVNPSDLSGMEHGTHVAGIAAANSGDQIRGTAPDAQIMPMKVADDFSGAIYDSSLLAAIDDAKALDADTVNMSLGSDAGFSEESTATYGDAIKALRDGGATVNVAAGNATTAALGNASGANLPYASDPDSSVISSPSSFPDSLSVASVNNAQRQSAFLGPDGTAIGYLQLGFADENGQATGDSTPGLSDKDKGLKDGEYEYVDGGIGSSEDQNRLANEYNWDLSGKIVVVKRGGTEPTDNHALTFGDKLMNVGTALNAAAVIFYNNADGAITGAAIKTGIVINIPVVSISGKDGEKLIAAADKKLTVKADATAAPSGYSMSDFTSWGVTPDLKLKPEITAPGGNIWSSIPNDKYEYMSGTSMATPQMAGISAQMHEYVDADGKFAGMSDAEKAKAVTRLLMSTAKPVASGDSYASPRQQGAGLADVPAATSTDVYLTVDGADDDSRPKADLGDSTDGAWSFTLTLHNLGGKARSYTPDAQALSEAVADGLFQNTDTNWTGKGIDVAYSGNGYDAKTGKVTVPANGSAKLTVTVTAAQTFKDFAAANTPNGTFVEGFAMLKAADKNGVDLSSPFVGFYGKWNQASVFDSALWEKGDKAYHVYGTALANPNNGLPLGINPLDGDATAGPVYDIDPNRMVVSRTNYSSSPIAAWPVTGLLRNANKLKYEYTDANGKVVRSYSYDYVSKSTLNQTTGSVLYAEARLGNGSGAFDGKSNDGTNLPDGTYTLRQTATTAGPGSTEQQSAAYQVTLDTKGPRITNMQLTGEGDAKTFSFDVTDESWLSAIDFHDPTTLAYFKRILAPADYTTNADGTRTWHFDVKVADVAAAWTASGLSGSLPNTVPLYAWDYGLNASDRTAAVMTPVAATGITVTPDKLTIAPGQTAKLKAAVQPADSTEQDLTWTSADPAKVKVDTDGTLTGVAPSDGKPVAVTVASKIDPDVKAVAQVTVADVTDETGIAMAQDSATIEPGKTLDVAAIVAPSLDGKKIAWSSSDEKVATVAAKDGQSGKAIVTAGEQVGTATITATVAGKSATMTVHVQPADFAQFVFDKDGTTLLGYTGNARDIVIPNNTKAIDYNAFANTQAVTITVPSSVETIGKQAFAGAGKLTTVTFQNDAKHPSRLKSIGDEAFTQNLALDTVNLPVDVKDFQLGVNVFYSSTLRHVTLPASLTEIPDGTFNGDAQLADVTISADTTVIGDNAFNANQSLGALKLVDRKGDVTTGWPQKLKTIGGSAFAGTAFAGVIELPASVRSIGDSAFALVGADVRLNDGLEFIGATALSGTTGTELVMPDSLDEVGHGAFSNMPNLAKATVGANVPDKQLEAAFVGDAKLAEFTVGKDVKHYSEFGGVLFNKDRTRIIAYPNANAQGPKDGVYTIPAKGENGFDTTVTDVAQYAFYDNSTLKGVKFTEGLKTIGDSAFLSTDFTEVVLPKTLETVAHGAFMNMANLKSVDFGGTITVGGSAFYSDPVLTDLNMRPEYNRLKSFGSLAFGQSPAITALDFPDSVTDLGDLAFSNITSLKKVHLGAGITSGVAGVFTGANGLSEITVSEKNPVYSASGNVLYQKQDDGLHLVLSAPGNPVTDYTVKDGTVAIEAQAFRNNHQLKHITLPASLKTTTTGSFNSTDGLTEVVFPDGFESTKSSFLFASGLEYVEFGTKTKNIQDEFWGHRPTHLVVRGGQDGTYTGGIIAGGMQTAYFGEGMTTLNISDTPSIVVVPASLKKLSLAGDGTVYAPAGSEGEKVAIATVGADRVKAYTPLTLTADIDGEVKAGAKVTAKAEAEGGVDGAKQYRFVAVAADGAETVLQDWSDAAQAEWTVPEQAGGVKVRVEVRDATWYSVAATATDATLDAARAALDESIAAAKAVKQGDKVDSAWKTLQDAIAAAEKARVAATATAGDLQQASATLDAAVTAFGKADAKATDAQRAALAEAIAAAKAVTQGKKTDEAWKTLQDAIAAAEKVSSDTSGDLSGREVDSATAALNAAVKAFQQSADKPGSGDNGGNGGNGGNGNGSGNAGGNAGNGSGAGSAAGNGQSGQNAADRGGLSATGSTILPLAVFVTVCVAIAAAATIARLRRKE